MGQLTRFDTPGLHLPAVIANAGDDAARRFVEFFTAEIRNPHTRDAYARAVARFLAWAEDRGLALGELSPVAVAAYVEALGRELAPASVKLHLAALRMLGDYLVTGGVLRMNPAASVRGPKLRIRTGKTPALLEEDARAFMGARDGDGLLALRDQALLCVMLYSFARVSAAVALQVKDYEGSTRRAFLALHEKGGQWRRVPVHSKAAVALDAWLEASGLNEEPDAPLFQAFEGRSETLSGRALTRRQALNIVKARARAAGLSPTLRSHSLRASGITDFLANGGTLEAAAELAGHASTRTTQLYDRRAERFQAEDIERIRI